MNIVRIRPLIAWAAVFCVAHPALGTDRYYRDVVAVSADGKLRLEAKSPDNAEDRHRSFAKNFVYVLSETATGRPIWDRKQAEREGSPRRAFVHNEGWVTVWTGFDDLLVFDPRGVLVLDLNILKDGLPTNEVKEFARETTAGLLWAGYSRWYFFSAGGRPYFALRTWWDRRIIISLQQAKLVPDETVVAQAANTAEHEFVLDTLRTAAQVARKWSTKKLAEYSSLDVGPWDEVNELRTAIHLAGRLRIKAAGPLLRELEPIPSFGSSISSTEQVPAGQLFLASSRFDRTRQQVQLALRRIGEKPACYPVRQLMQTGKNSEYESPYVRPKQEGSRVARLADLAKDPSPLTVVETIGEPDYVVRPGPGDKEANWVWEYDIDADKPFTLRLVWHGQFLKSIERIEPPRWKDSNTRDMQD